MTVFHYKIQEDGQTIEHLLREQWQAGKKTIHLMRMAKSVTDVNGEPVIWQMPLDAGTELSFDFSDARSTYVPQKLENLTVLFEDDHILAVVKPAGIATHPDKPSANRHVDELRYGVYSKYWWPICRAYPSVG